MVRRGVLMVMFAACVANPPPQNTPGPPGTWSCKQIVESCDSQCSTGICLNACSNQGTQQGGQLHAALIQCAAMNRCFDNNCTRALCGPQVDACAADGGTPIASANPPPMGNPPMGNPPPTGEPPPGNSPPTSPPPPGNAQPRVNPNASTDPNAHPNPNANPKPATAPHPNANANPTTPPHPNANPTAPPHPNANPEPTASPPNSHPHPDTHPAEPPPRAVTTADITGDWSYGAKTALGAPDPKTGAPRPGAGTGGILRLTSDGRFERATSVEAAEGTCKTITFRYAIGAWKLDGATLILNEKQAFASFRDSCHKAKNTDREDDTHTDRRQVRVNDKREIEVTDDTGELQSYRKS